MVAMENIPLGHWTVWAVYLFAHFWHIITQASIAAKSKLNQFVHLRDYLRARWIPIVGRLLLSIFIFIMIWDNPAMFNVDRFFTTKATQLALSGILGWFTDSVLDKGFGFLSQFIPGLQREVPVVPPPDDAAPEEKK